MHIVKRMAPAAVLLAAVFLLTACPSQTTISKINADPGRYRGKEVGIVGNVTDSYGVLGNGAYEIDDGTGRIWVATRRGVPSRGSRVGVKGRVLNGFPMGRPELWNSPGRNRPHFQATIGPAPVLHSTCLWKKSRRAHSRSARYYRQFGSRVCAPSFSFDGNNRKYRRSAPLRSSVHACNLWVALHRRKCAALCRGD